MILTPKTIDIEELYGSVSAKEKANIDEMDQAIKKRINQNFLTSFREPNPPDASKLDQIAPRH